MELISFGDPIFMSGVLRAISMMANVGTFASLGAIGLLLGLLLMGFQGLGKGQIDLAGWGTSLILYLVMFTIPTEVVVIEKTPGWGRTFVRAPIVIDDVPIGVAAMGWFVSQTGYRLSQRMEEAFGIPTEGASAGSLMQGFGRTLEVLAVVREAHHPVVVGGSDRNLAYATWRKSLVAYLSDCTAPKLAANPDMLTAMPTLEDPISMSASGIGYNSEAHRTTNYRAEVNAGGATQVTEPDVSCADQFLNLKAREAEAVRGYYETTLSRVAPTGANTMQTVNDAYDVIGMTAVEAQRFVVAHILKGSFAEAAKRGANGHEVLLLAMVDEAAMQRASQFAGEESMFLRMARPMIAFFETVVYIAAPFMALAIGFGRVGQGMVLKYALLTVWVALWMPTLTALNLFSSQMAGNAIQATFNTADAAGRKGAGSLVGAEQILAQAEDWLGAAALLMASTPAITLMLVFGTAMTAVGVAQRMQGADTINEKTPTPDAVGTSPAIAAGALGTSSALGGYRGNGAPSYMLSTGNATSAGVSSAATELAAAEQSFTQQWGSRVASTLSSGFTAAAQRGSEARLGQLVSGTESAIASREVRDALEGLTDSQKAAAFEYVGRAMAGGEAGLNLGAMLSKFGGKGGKNTGGGEVSETASAGPASAGFKFGGSADSVERQSNGLVATQRAVQAMLGAMRNDSGVRAEVQNALAQTAMEVGRSEAGSKNEAVNSAEFQQSARALSQASENYQKTQAASNTFGAQRSVDLAAVAQGLSGNQEAMQALRQAVSQFAGGQDGLNEAKHRAGSDFAQFGGPENREAMALIDQLAGNGSVKGGSGFADERLQAIGNAMRAAGFGGMSGGQPASDASNGIEAKGPSGPGFTAGDVQSSVDGNLDKVNPGEVRAAASAQPSISDPRLAAASGSDAAAVDAAGSAAAEAGTDVASVNRGATFQRGADAAELKSADERTNIARGGAETAVRGMAADNESGLTDNVSWQTAPQTWPSDMTEQGGQGLINLPAYEAAVQGALARPDDTPPEVAVVAGYMAAVMHGGGAIMPNEADAQRYNEAREKLSPEWALAANTMAETMGMGPEGSSDVPVTNFMTTAASRLGELPLSQTQEIIAPYGEQVGRSYIDTDGGDGGGGR